MTTLPDTYLFIMHCHHTTVSSGNWSRSMMVVMLLFLLLVSCIFFLKAKQVACIDSADYTLEVHLYGVIYPLVVQLDLSCAIAL